MSDVVVFTGPQKLRIKQEKDKALTANEVRIQTLYSGISAGTELTAYRGNNPYLHKRWDAIERLFVASASSTIRYPVTCYKRITRRKAVMLPIRQTTRARVLDTTYFFAASIARAKGSIHSSIQSGLAPVCVGARHAASIIS